jgi:ribosomal protein S18 acetylase RimI-like enzyme
MARDLDAEVTARARAWRTAALEAVCDVVEPWEHGTVWRATRYPTYFDFNLVRVDGDPGMTVDRLAAFADEALAGLIHRRFDFDVVGAADERRSGFTALGWRSLRLLWMRHEAGRMTPSVEGLSVEQVPYDAVHDLRVAWYTEDHPDQIAGAYHEHAREVAMRRGAQVLAVRDRARPIAFVQLERAGDAAEITQVYVHPGHRGAGIGTSITRAAIDAAGDVRDLWIAADDEDRPKELYARLGFRPAWTAMEITRWPGARAAPG